MEGKVILYDSNDIRIGETFTRRARQLVKQQRASWIGDNQEAIRFAPGMEKLDETMDDHIHEKHVMHSRTTDDELLKLARRRVHARFGFRLHCALVLIIGAFLIIIHLLTDPGGYFWPIWPILSFGLSVLIHGAIYKLYSGNNMNDKIAREYESLKFRHSYFDSDAG